jgi:hypothetical protein
MPGSKKVLETTWRLTVLTRFVGHAYRSAESWYCCCKCSRVEGGAWGWPARQKYVPENRRNISPAFGEYHLRNSWSTEILLFVALASRSVLVYVSVLVNRSV